MRTTSDTLFGAASLLGCDWSTRRKRNKPGGPDFEVGQVCVVHRDIPGKGTFNLARFRYVGDDQWEEAPE